MTLLKQRSPRHLTMIGNNAPLKYMYVLFSHIEDISVHFLPLNTYMHSDLRFLILSTGKLEMGPRLL